MEVLNKSLDCSYSKNLFNSLQESARSEERVFSQVFYVLSAVATSVTLSPVEAIARFALALITSIALIGRSVGGEMGKKIAQVPVKFYESGLKSMVPLVILLTAPIIGCLSAYYWLKEQHS
jgi:hypothetical protein